MWTFGEPTLVSTMAALVISTMITSDPFGLFVLSSSAVAVRLLTLRAIVLNLSNLDGQRVYLPFQSLKLHFSLPWCVSLSVFYVSDTMNTNRWQWDHTREKGYIHVVIETYVQAETQLLNTLGRCLECSLFQISISLLRWIFGFSVFNISQCVM